MVAPFLLVLLAVLSPPAVPWAPARGIAVVRAYLPFAALWLLAALLYTRRLRGGPRS